MNAIKLTLAILAVSVVTGTTSARAQDEVVNLPLNNGNSGDVCAVDSYASQTLRGNFLLQRFRIPNYPTPFWGVRIVGLDPNSPLRQLGLKVGDVLTRLDGMRVSDHRFLSVGPGGSQYWSIPELERHYSITEVRYIKTGTIDVRNGQINLGPPQGPGPNFPVNVP